MNRSAQRKYDWFGYAVWFAAGAALFGLPWFVFHFVLETREMSAWQMYGLLVVCLLAGGLYGGRRHRRRWEAENQAGAVMDELLNRRRGE